MLKELYAMMQSFLQSTQVQKFAYGPSLYIFPNQVDDHVGVLHCLGNAQFIFEVEWLQCKKQT